MALVFAMSFFLGSYCECFVRTVPAKSCDYFTKSCDNAEQKVCAPTPIHAFISRAQGTSETSENKYADIQKVNSCLQQDQFPWELQCAGAITVSHVYVYVWL